MKIETKKVNDLIPSDYNPRRDLRPGDDEYEKIKRSIETFGMVEPIVFNEHTNRVVGGHQRLKVLQDLGWTESEVSVVDLHENNEKALNVALNKIEGDWDNVKLKDLLEELDNGAYDVELTGFDMDEVESLMTQYFDEDKIQEDEDFDVEKATEKAKEETRTEQGDIWQLGDHKLIVGDATNKNDILALLGSSEADMVFTDPPYNVDYEGGTEDSLKIQNDNFEDEEFYQFLLQSYQNMENALKAGGALYICHADSEGINFRKAFVDSGLLLKQCLIWVKNSLVLGRQDYQWKHEPILYGWKPGASHNWYNDRKQTTVQEIPADLSIDPKKDHTILTFNSGVSTIAVKVNNYEILHDGTDELTTTRRIERPSRSADHPTMKPIKLCARGIMNSSKKGEIVLDPFAGSGSTLIACEQTDRYCRALEFDPVYADVIINRWEELTGQKAIKVT